jgi:hypothetical protein
MRATVGDGWTEAKFSDAGILTAVSGAEVFYRLRTDDGREFTAEVRDWRRSNTWFLTTKCSNQNRSLYAGVAL